MRIRPVLLVATTFVALAATAGARVGEPPRTRVPSANVPQHVGTVRHVVGKATVRLEPLAGAPLDTSDPWTGAPIDASRSHATIDDRDPWTGEVIAARATAQVDATDPWR